MVVSNIFAFHHYLGKISNLTQIFQMGWNHQPEWHMVQYHTGTLDCCASWYSYTICAIPFFGPAMIHNHASGLHYRFFLWKNHVQHIFPGGLNREDKSLRNVIPMQYKFSFDTPCQWSERGTMEISDFPGNSVPPFLGKPIQLGELHLDLPPEW